MSYTKITTGFVIQDFDDNGDPIDQVFIAGDEAKYVDDDGEPVDRPDKETLLSFLMVQATDVLQRQEGWSNGTMRSLCGEYAQHGGDMSLNEFLLTKVACRTCGGVGCKLKEPE